MITSYYLKFGTSPGEYAVTTVLTDSLLGRVELTNIILDNVPIQSGFVHDKVLCTLDLSAFSVISGSELTLNFKYSIPE